MILNSELHIRQELQRVGRPYREKRKDFATSCINPSCSSYDAVGKLKLEISKDGSRAHCWVCDWSGSWDSFAKEVGLQPLKTTTPGTYSEAAFNHDFTAQLHKSIVENNKDLLDYDLNKEGSLPSHLIPWSKYTKEAWRGLSVSFLTELGASYWVHKTSYSSTPRILLPFYQYGKLVGYTGRRLDKESNLKYYNAPWAKAKNILYPYDFVIKLKPSSLVLVEGQVDALNLIYNGIPALCIMGVQNWSNYKRDLLLNSTVKNIYICMDGDEAGTQAVHSLYYGTDRYTSLQKYFDKVDIIKLPKDVDPGSLAPSQLAWLKNYVGVS